jgi:hypothetical protein
MIRDADESTDRETALDTDADDTDADDTDDPRATPRAASNPVATRTRPTRPPEAKAQPALRRGASELRPSLSRRGRRFSRYACRHRRCRFHHDVAGRWRCGPTRDSMPSRFGPRFRRSSSRSPETRFAVPQRRHLKQEHRSRSHSSEGPRRCAMRQSGVRRAVRSRLPAVRLRYQRSARCGRGPECGWTPRQQSGVPAAPTRRRHQPTTSQKMTNRSTRTAPGWQRWPTSRLIRRQNRSFLQRGAASQADRRSIRRRDRRRQHDAGPMSEAVQVVRRGHDGLRASPARRSVRHHRRLHRGPTEAMSHRNSRIARRAARRRTQVVGEHRHRTRCRQLVGTQR